MGLLSDVRVVGLAQYGAGPYALQHMADLGAEVIRIEKPGTGDYGRRVPPFADSEGNDSLFFQAFSRNQKSLTLDVETVRGQEVLRALVAKSDVCFNNLRPNVATRLGLNYRSLSGSNLKIVCCSLTGYGVRSERSNDPGFDYIVQGESGIMDLAGDPEGPPVKAGVSMIDFATGISASFAMTAGVLNARTSGRGGDIDVSLMDTAISLTNYIATWYLTNNYVPERMRDSAHPSLVPSQLFACADQAYIIVMVNKEHFWPKLCHAIGRPELIADGRFDSFNSRFANRAELIELLEEVFTTRTRDEWLEELTSAQVPCGPVNTLAEAFEDPDIRGRTATFPHEVFGSVSTPGRLVDAPDSPPINRAPKLGEHTEEVVVDLLGFPKSTLDDLRRDGVV